MTSDSISRNICRAAKLLPNEERELKCCLVALRLMHNTSFYEKNSAANFCPMFAAADAKIAIPLFWDNVKRKVCACLHFFSRRVVCMLE